MSMVSQILSPKVIIDIPRVIKNGLHPIRTKVSQAAYIDSEVVLGMLCESI